MNNASIQKKTLGLGHHPAREARPEDMPFRSPEAAKIKERAALRRAGIVGCWVPEAAQPGPFVATEK